MAHLGAAGDAAAKNLRTLDVQQARLAATRQRLLTRQATFMPGGARITALQARQQALVNRNLLNQRRQLESATRAESRLLQLERSRYDINTRILRAQELQRGAITRIRGAPTPARLGRAQRQLMFGRRAEISGTLQLAENTSQIAAVNRQLENQRRLLLQTREIAAGYGAQFARETAMIDAELANVNRQLEINSMQWRNNAIAQREAIAAERAHRWDRIGLGARALSDLGRTAQFAGVIVVGALGYMAKAAADFGTQATLAATQVTNRFKEIGPVSEQIQKGIIAQMQKFPAAARDMTKSAYDIFSTLVLQGNAAQRTAKGLQVLNTFNKAAVGGQANLVDVTRAGVTILNQFAKAGRNGAVDISKLTKFMNIMFAAVKFGRVNMDEFTQTLAQAAPAARATHQSFASMAATVAYLTKVLPVRQAAVGYARLLDVFQRMAPGLRRFGIEIRTSAGYMKPLQNIIGAIVKRFPDLAKGKQFIIPWLKEMTKGTGQGTMATAQARRGLIFLIQRYTDYRHTLRAVTKDQGEFQRSVRALGATSGVRLRVFINQMHALALVIGRDATPALMKMLRPIQSAIKWFNGLSRTQKQNITTIVAWTGGLLILGGTLAVLVGTVGRIIAGLSRFATATGGARLATAGFASEAGAISVVFARRMGIGAVIAAMIIFHRQTAAVVHALGGAKNLIGLVATLLTVRMVRAWYVAAAAAIKARLSIVLSEAAIGTGALAAATKVDILKASLLTLGRLGPIAVTIAIYEEFTHAKGITDFFKKHIPGYKAFGDFVDKHVGFLRRLDQAHGLLAPGEAGTSFLSKQEQIAVRRAKLIKYGFELMKKYEPKRYQKYLHDYGLQMMKQYEPQKWLQYMKAHDPQVYAKAVQVVAHAQASHNQQIQHYIKLAIQANRIARARPHDFQAQLRAAQIMAQINTKFKGAELDAINAIISADNSATKKRIANAKKAANASIDSVRDAVNNMRQIYDQFLQQNQQALGSITEGIRTQNELAFGGVPTPRDLLADLRQQVNNFMRFRNELAQLAARGVPFALIQQLEQGGMQAEPIARGLLHMNRRQMSQYIALFQKGQQAVQKATKIDFNFQLADWRKHGRRAAILFMRGMADEQSFISKEMKRIYLDWLKGQATTFGTQGGAHHGHRRRPPGQRTLQSTNTTHTTVNHNDNKVIVNQGKEDLSTTLRKTRLHQRHRRFKAV